MKRFEGWWFGWGSPVSMGVFRIVMGFVIFSNMLMVGLDFDAWFTERGFVPAAANRIYLGSEPRLSLLGGATSTPIVAGFFAAVTLAALFTSIGLWTRVSSVVLLLGIITLHHRNAAILHGGDLVMKVGAVSMALAPSGAACSLDRLVALWKGKAPPIPEAVSLWPQRLLQYQVALIYFTTVWHKWYGPLWQNGTATWYPLHLGEFERFWLPSFMRENALFIAATTYGTLATELALATLVFFKPWRKWVLLAGVGMHLFIEYAMNIPLFAFAMIATYLAFYDGGEVSAWSKSLGERFKRFRIEVSLPKGMRWAEGRGDAIVAMDPFGLIHYQEGDALEWQAHNSMGEPIAPWAATWVRSVGAWPLPRAWRGWRGMLNSALVPASSQGSLGAEEAAAHGAAR